MRGLSLALYALSASFVAANFTEPNGSNGDFYRSWAVGDTIDIAWNAGWDWGKGAQPDIVDLFVMWFDHPTAFSQLVLANVSLATSGSYTWHIDVANDKVAQEPKFVFRFSQHTEPEVFDWELPKMPSRGFILRQKAEISSSSGSTSATATKSRASAPVIPASASSALIEKATSASGHTSSTSETSAAGEKKMNTAAIAAGVLGGLVGVAVILGGVLFFLRQARKRREAEGAGGLMKDEKAPRVYANYAQELPGAPPSELHGDRSGQTRELKGSTPRDWH